MTVPLPRFVQIEPVGQCNLACRMCPVTLREDGGPGKPPAFMPFETFASLIDQFPDLTELHLQGLGEPLLHPRFFDMVAYAAARGIEVSTNTNLTALSPRRAEQAVRSGLARMHMSLDAADPAAYEYIRVGARFDRVLRNLEMLVDAKRRCGALFPELRLVAVLMRRTLDGLPELVRFAHQQGVAVLSVQHLAHDFTESTLPEKYAPMREFVDAESVLQIDASQVAGVFEQASALAIELGVELRLPRISNERMPKRGCDWPWRGAYVAYSGQAMPCCMVATPDRVNFGNMAREGVERIWDNDAYNDFRGRLASDTPPEICSGCAVYRGVF
jgi:radical SAM protein with 4Fe4S-binding SPASM domain